MSDNAPEVTAVDAPPTTGYALYDTAELRFLDGVYPTAKAARDAHKDRVKEGRTYEARKV